MPSRHASHSGSWYSDSARTLTRQLDGWLAQVPDTMEKVGSLPTPGARVIIAPYA
jgi:predicted class III extradiol MEMO1 family dioxygenase